MFLIFEVFINMFRKPGNGQRIEVLHKGRWEAGTWGNHTIYGWTIVTDTCVYRKLPLIWRSV